MSVLFSRAFQTLSPRRRYERLLQGDNSQDDAEVQDEEKILRKRPKSILATRWFTVVLVTSWLLLLAGVVVESWFILQMRRDAPYNPTGLSTKYDQFRVTNENSVFHSLNDTEADAAWANIKAGHGDVALDPTWSASHGLGPSYKHPLDPSKNVYVIEAYHEIHCLKVLRDHYMRMYHAHQYVGTWPQPADWNVENDKYCFDSLRQHVMCHADDTLLYSKGHFDVGVGQMKKCRNWDKLREWATERSAGWRDHINPRPEGELWWKFSDGGDDGLPRGSL